MFENIISKLWLGSFFLTMGLIFYYNSKAFKYLSMCQKKNIIEGDLIMSSAKHAIWLMHWLLSNRFKSVDDADFIEKSYALKKLGVFSFTIVTSYFIFTLYVIATDIKI